MRIQHIKSTVLLVATLGLLAACGGGGDQNAGAPTALTLSTNTLTFKPPAGTPTGTCTGGGTAQIFVYGGAAPYRIDNGFPNYVMVTPSQVSDRGGSFTVTMVGGCLSPGSISVVDALSNIVTLTVNNNPA